MQVNSNSNTFMQMRFENHENSVHARSSTESHTCVHSRSKALEDDAKSVGVGQQSYGRSCGDQGTGECFYRRDEYVSSLADFADALRSLPRLHTLGLRLCSALHGVDDVNVFTDPSGWCQDLGRALRGMTQLRELKVCMDSCESLNADVASWRSGCCHTFAGSACSACVPLRRLIPIMLGHKSTGW